MKVMVAKSQNKDKTCMADNNKPFEVVESFKHLGLEVPSNRRWNERVLVLTTRKWERGFTMHRRTYAPVQKLNNT